MNVAKDWQDYEILDMANGEKLERWKNVILVRPDPQIIWTQKIVSIVVLKSRQKKKLFLTKKVFVVPVAKPSTKSLVKTI